MVVHTISGATERTVNVPLGSAPVPIDVDDLDNLSPDILVSAGMVAVTNSPGNELVPNIEIKRASPTGPIAEPSPPLIIDATITIRDASNNMSEFAVVHFGYATPAGGQIPPILRGQLTGSIADGYVDPLKAELQAPGYHGPLTVNLAARTRSLDATFGLNFDPLPEVIRVVEDPHDSDDGLDFHYDHDSPLPSVKLAATADLREPSGVVNHIGAVIDRLPKTIDFTYTPGDISVFDFRNGTTVAKPDVEATYRSTTPNGTIISDALARLTGVPSHIKATITTVPASSGSGRDIGAATFNVTDGGQIDAVDFSVKNWDDVNSPVPVHALGPDQFVAVSSRRMASGTTLYRAQGRLTGVRSLAFTRLPNNGFDAVSDLGDGVSPMRAILDLDDRGSGAPNDARKIFVDTTVTPLPRTIHARFEPSAGANATRLLYEANQTIDVASHVVLANGVDSDCGRPLVTCADARVDKLPPRLEVFLPGDGGTDFSISHNGTGGSMPDVRAVADRTGATAATRTWVSVELLRVPNHVTGRIRSEGDTVAAAEFHACTFDFGANACTDAQGALGQVSFVARRSPERSGLPARPDTQLQFVTLLSRNDLFEAAGRVQEVRNVVFHQRVVNGQASGTLGALIDVGSGGQFDIVVDDVDGDDKTNIRVNVNPLPSKFSACFRQQKDTKPPVPSTLAPDTLLTECDRTDVVGNDSGEAPVTPLTAFYTATAPQPVVTADVLSIGPKTSDNNRSHTSRVHVHIDKLPSTLRTDFIPSLAPPAHPGRKLKVRYGASSPIETINFDFETRRTDSVCEDPRPGHEALCMNATLHKLPGFVGFSFDPDDSKGDIDFRSSAPTGADKFSIDPIHLSTVTAEEGSRPLLVDGRILGLTTHITGKLQSGFLHNPPAVDEDKTLTNINVNACPGDIVTTCNGIDTIELHAKNTLVDDLLVQPAPDPLATQNFTYVARGEDFRADAFITQFREIAMSKLDSNNDPFAELTSLRASFGNGSSEKLRAFVDTDDGSEAALIDALISKVPRAINVCFRDVAPLRAGGNFCQHAPSNKLAIEASLDEARALTGGPDIEIRRFKLTKGGGASILTGTASVLGLGEKVQVQATKGDDPDILLEGRRISDNALINAANRVVADLRNFDGGVPSVFPFGRLDGPTADPEINDITIDNRNLDSVDGRNNFLIVGKDPKRLALRGSIPNIKRVHLRSGACDSNDARFVDPTLFPEDRRPKYTCANVNVGAGRPLGLAVRTLDENDEVLSIDEGFIDSVPAGDRGISATIGKAAAALGNATPVCVNASSAVAPDYCRPPLLSVQADKAAGQVSNAQLRLALGPRNLVGFARTAIAPDELSQRLDYEQFLKNYAQSGGRVKIVTKGDDTVVRAGLNLAIPGFLDFDPPISYTCERQDAPPSPCVAGATDIGSESNNGFKAKDIFVKLVGANNQRLGSDLDYLGRVALMAIDLNPAGSTIVVTGAPGSDGPNGESSVTPENRAPVALAGPDAYDLGARVPGHLEAKVFLRTKYEAPGDDDKQSTYAQVDATLNTPLTASVRIDDAGTTGEARDGTKVPSVNLTIRNAPGLGANAPDLSKPTFRVRAELHKKHVDNSSPGFFECAGDGIGPSFRAAGFGLDACIILPTKVKVKYLDVSVNATPDPSKPPARTIDAVVDPRGSASDVEVRAFEQVRGPGPKGPTAALTPQAALRLANFTLGLKVGAGIGIVGGSTSLIEVGDLFLRANGLGSHRLRLSHNAGALRLVSQDGVDRVDTHMKAKINIKVTGEALFGLVEEDIIDENLDVPHHELNFNVCAGPFITPLTFVDHFSTTGNSKVAISFGAPSGVGGPLAAVFTAVSKVLSPFFCFLGTEDGAMVDLSGGSPRPAFHELDAAGNPIRPIDDASTPQAPPAVAHPPAGTGARTDVTVSTPQTFCGDLGAKTLHVTSTGAIVVGTQGASVATTTTSADGHAITTTIPCDGTLTINADNVVVDPGGSISASARRVAPGPGTPTGTGGGAGHRNPGGASGLAGGPGGPSYGAGTTLITEPGSPGAAGSSGVSGGAGGGALRIAAASSITINGTLTANGASGTPSSSPTCANTGAGGGSGGAIELIANRVTVTGSLTANGGNGGNGGAGGGGGSGGRIAISTVIRSTPGSLGAAGGSGGTPGAGCAAGGNGGGGDTTLGVELVRAAGVTISTQNSFTNGSIPLAVHGVQKDGGPMDILVCHKVLPPTASDPFSNPALNPPPPPASAADLLSEPGATCQSVQFAAPTDPATNAYEDTLSLTGADGYYGVYAFAAKPKPFGFFGILDPACTSGSTSFCDYQTLLPTKTTERIGLDNTAPAFPVFEAFNGTPGCPGAALCLPSPLGDLHLQITDNMSGVTNAQCAINGGAYVIPCLPGGDHVRIGLGSDGAKSVRAQAFDRAGNVGISSSVLWFVDSRKPNAPAIALSNSGAAINGWYQQKPTVAVTATDLEPSSGFQDNKVTFFTDAADNPCGTAAGNTITCSTAQTEPFVPDEGQHTFEAQATDVVGFISPLSNKQTMRVDKTPPVSRLFLAPLRPDGLNGWYRTAPVVAFGAVDKVGGSGVKFGLAPSGVTFTIDGGPTRLYDPTADVRLTDGIHRVCFKATDVAGNVEPEHCVDNIRVDTTAPVVSDPITPLNPDGRNSWYVTDPQVTPTISDPVPTPVIGTAESCHDVASSAVLSPATGNSGVDPAKFQYQIDDDSWLAAAPFLVPAGIHDIRVRGCDLAGNAAVMTQRTVRVDLSTPAVRVATFPATANDQGWFRQRPMVSIATTPGRDAPQVDTATYSIDGGPSTAYFGEFGLPDGEHDVTVTVTDLAGASRTLPPLHIAGDITPPIPTAGTGGVALPIAPAQLTFNVLDGQAKRVKVQVIVYDTFQNIVRRLDAAGTYPGGFRDVGPGFVLWDGKDDAGAGVEPGFYFFRVVALDQSGHSAVSSESLGIPALNVPGT